MQPRTLDTCATLTHSLASQAITVDRENRFHKEPHIHVLANLKQQHILCFQEKTKDMYNCQVDVMHYKPGYNTQRKITKQETKEVLSIHTPVCIHLNWRPTHFSAIVHAAEKSHQPRGMDFKVLSNGSIQLSDDDE